MPSVSPAQHRWIGYLHSNPAAQKASGMSKAKVDEWLHSDKGSPWKRADGGITDTAAPPIEPSLQTASPMMQGMIQRYSSLPTERLRELSVMMGQSPQGQVIGRLLQQRNMMPQSDPAIAQQPQVGMRRGGVPGRQAGGETWETRSDYRAMNAPAQEGLLMGSSMGRGDKVQTSAPGGSYVVPAEVISGIGEGNSLAGARMMQSMLSSGPWGTPMPRMSGRNTIPRAPALPRDAGGSVPLFDARAAGGVATNRPVDLSHGEFVISPQQVTQIGGGDWATGKRILDRWVVSEHRKHAKKLATIAGPVGMRK